MDDRRNQATAMTGAPPTSSADDELAPGTLVGEFHFVSRKPQASKVTVTSTRNGAAVAWSF